MTIGDRITYYRNKNHLTIQEVADKLEVAKATISKYENGIITNIPSDRIEKLAQLFGTTPAVLMGWTADQPDDEPPAPSDDPTFITLAHKLRKLDPENLKKVDKALTALFPEDFE